MRDHSFPNDVTVNRILVVEEHREEAERLRCCLKEHQFVVDLAQDAGQAHAAFHLHPPDFVILEAILPNDVSGFEVCEWVKREDSTIPVIMLTVIDRDDARALARRVGVDAYLVKPFQPKTLIEQLRTAENGLRQRESPPRPVETVELVRFACHGCGKSLKADLIHRGRTFHCPQCGQSVVVPAQ